MRLRWNKGTPISLSTERFTLQSVSQRWIARRSFPWTQDPTVMAGIQHASGSWLLRRWRRQFVISDNQSKICLAIHEKQNGRLIGCDTITIHGRVAEMSVLIGETDWWGKGVVAETRAAILDYLFDTRECVKVSGRPYARNFASIFNYQRLGFTKEGVLRKEGRSTHGDGMDLIAFGILPEEWRARRKETSS